MNSYIHAVTWSTEQMDEPEMLFQVKLWDAVAKWAAGNTHEKMAAVVSVNRLIEARFRDEKTAGIKLAASVAADYDKYSSHPYLVSDCILGKLNVIPGKPRRNKFVNNKKAKKLHGK